MTLADFQTTDGFFTIAPFDHRASLAESLHLNLEDNSDKQLFLELKQLFMSELSPHVSAVLTDPDIGIQTIDQKAPGCGLFLSLEESGYSGDHDALTSLKPNWGIDSIKQLNAGAKLLVYFNPASSTAAAKLDLVKSLCNEARQKDVVFLVEPVLYALPTKQWEKEYDSEWIAVYLDVCRQFAPYCDILKIQYPGSREACLMVSSLHPNWILLSRGANFSDFKEYLRTAAASGCKGYAAGRAVWQELSEFHDATSWKRFLDETAVPRLQELTAILKAAYVASR